MSQGDARRNRVDSRGMERLFRAVREACPAGTWSRGVELARREAVRGEKAGGDEIVLRVSQPGSVVAPTVSLFPGETAWECDCDSPQDPCVHVAAAVIACKRAQEAGAAMPRPASSLGRLGYRFSRRGGELLLERVIVRSGSELPLRSSLAALASGRAEGPEVQADERDLRVDELLDGRVSGALHAELLERLLGALAGSAEVRLDGAPVRTSREPVLPRALLEDRGEGFALSLSREAGLEEVFANGAARVGDELRPLGDAHLSLRERRELMQGMYFGPDARERLLSEVLPALERRIPLEIRSARVQRAERIPPRLRVETAREGDSLSVHARIVYGEPPCAEVIEGRLIHLVGPHPVRDRIAEERLERESRHALGIATGAPVAFAPADAIALRPRLERLGASVAGDAHRAFFAAGALHPELRLDADQFAASFRCGGATVSGDAVLRAWRSGESFVSLSGGGFAELPRDWLERSGSALLDLLAARDATGRLPRAALFDLAHLCELEGEPLPDALGGLRSLIDGFERLPEPVLPEDLRATLRGYQREGVRWLAFLREAGLGGLLADDMGLGKTLQALCSLRGRTLVVCPTSVLYAWREQIERFRPALRVSLYHGPRRALEPAADLTLTTYALLRLDQEPLSACEWETVILDEAQAIKNPASQVARAAFRLPGRFRLAMTGTPVENRLEELWSELHFANPGLLGTRERFDSRFGRPIAVGDAQSAADLRRRLRPFLLRRRKAEVAPELPPRTEAVLHCELDQGERAVYDAVRAAARREVLARLRGGGSVLEALEALLRLRQAACHAGLVPGQSAARSSKLDLLVETLDEVVAEGHKALVFSQWTSLLDRAEPALREAGLAFTRLDGSTRDRGAVVASFQAADGPPVLLISLRAGGTGLTLTAADHVFLLDPWWNPAVEEQAADRAHRIGQGRPVFVYRLVARDTVEERILALQEHKRALAEAALGEGERATSLTREDLLALLED